MARGNKNESDKAKKPGNTQSNSKRVSKTKKKPDAAVEKKSKDAPVQKKINGPAKAKLERIAKWETPENLILLEGWAREGLSIEQIAFNMGFKAKSTLYEYMKSSSAISNALKKGKEVTDYCVENALFAAAMAGNVTAQIFWLKCRQPEKWRERNELKVEADVEQSGGVILLAPRLEEDDE